MREFATMEKQEYPEDMPWNVQVWREVHGRRWYSGEGRFCRTEQEAREWAEARGLEIVRR